MRNRVIELIRVSTEGQAANDRGGIPAQRAANRATAERHGLEIIRTFQIEDVSGSRVLASPEMQELLRVIEAPQIVGVVAKEFSRLMRPEDLGDFAILQRFIETRTVLYLPDGPVDLGNKSGRLFGVLRAAMAGYERQEILERMTDAKEAIRRAGRHPGGWNSLPFGVAWDPAQGWSYTPEAEKVKVAFRQVLTTTRPYAAIAADLGIGRTSLRVILQNPIWTGWRVYDKRRDQSAAGYVAAKDGRQGYRRKVARPASDIIRLKVLPGIVSETDFARVQEVLADRAARERVIRRKNAPFYTFNGFLACALCGDPLYTHRNRRAPYYVCKKNGTRARHRGEGCANPYVLAAKVEAKVEELLSRRLQHESALEAIAQELVKAQERPQIAGMDPDAAKELCASLEAKRTRVLDGFFEGVITRPERDKRLKAIDTELAACHDMLARTAPQSSPPPSAAQLADVLSVFAEFPYLNRDQKRSLLASLKARVFMERYTIQRLEISPPFDAEPTPGGSYNDSPRQAAGA